MDYPNHITDHKKGKRLTYEDYVVIALRLKDGWKPNAIAQKELHCAPNTVRNIIKKGMTPLYNDKVFRFKAKTAWNAYQGNRSRSCRTDPLILCWPPFRRCNPSWGDYFSKVFRTITIDNGPEFARLAELETGTNTKVYFTHPYISCEKGAIENHNGLV